MSTLLTVFISLKMLKWLGETGLAHMNRSYYRNQGLQAKACKDLDIKPEAFAKTLAYTEAKFALHQTSELVSLLISLGFIGFGGLGILERWAMACTQSLGWGESSVVVGLLFFGGLGLLSALISMPFDLYSTFKVEEQFGFNRQTPASFLKDKAKGLVLGVALGGLLLSLILWVMESVSSWWVGAWMLVNAFSFILLWLYPTFLAPLFNKFTPVPEGELKEGIYTLASKVNFRTAGIFIMDASTRSTHGNAYFTGVMGEKRIVLFDTLLQTLTPKEIVAVLAHELGHFKLNQVRLNLIRSIFTTGLVFYLMNVCQPLTSFYHAFSLTGVTSYGALLVFSLWFGILDFVLTPLSSFLSRRHEFQADAFAKEHMAGHEDLSHALVKLQKSNAGMPLAHPLYSSFYFSHPPILERIQKLEGAT